jgi:hypothetical protein
VLAVDGRVDGVALFWGPGGGARSPGRVDAEGGGHVELWTRHRGCEGLGAAGLAVVDAVQVGVGLLEVRGWGVGEDGRRVQAGDGDVFELGLWEMGGHVCWAGLGLCFEVLVWPLEHAAGEDGCWHVHGVCLGDGLPFGLAERSWRWGIDPGRVGCIRLRHA